MQRMPVRSAGGVVPASLPNQSLAERLHDLRSQTDVRPDQLGKLYDRLFQQHFGRWPHRRTSLRDNTTFGRVFAWCLNHDVNPEDYISANMRLLGPRLGRHSFRPNMLVGPRAESRYNGALGRANRRFGTGSQRVFLSRETWIGRIRTNLALSESEVADLFVSLALADDQITWDEASAMVTTSQDWRDYRAKTGCWHKLVWQFGPDGAKREGLIASLTAAWQIAEKLRHGLGDCIGFVDFSWPAFVRILRHAGFAPKRRSDTASLQGMRMWRVG